jgi:hypothetical protein
MGALFSPKVPSVPAPTPPPAPVPAPTIDAARQAQQSRDTVASRQGRAASILTGATGDLGLQPAVVF